MIMSEENAPTLATSAVDSLGLDQCGTRERLYYSYLFMYAPHQRAGYSYGGG